jgi:octaprenyl-diphosphate synthase
LKNKIAVLVGDYLLSKGLLLSIDNGDFDLLRIISVAVREMSEGKLLQIEKARKLVLLGCFIMKSSEKSSALMPLLALGAQSVIEDEVQLRTCGNL